MNISDLEIGWRVAAATHTLAYACGDRTGSIEAIDGASIICRMDQSGRLVPFRVDQIQPIPCPYCSGGKRTGLPGNACENCMNSGIAHS